MLHFLKGLPFGQPVLVACSGGADSVFLTLVLEAFFHDQPERLRLLHFNHGIRGADADGDADFVVELANGIGCSCRVGHPPHQLDIDEACLRAARYEWFGQVYKEVGAGALALGQHADDLLESQVMGLLSGSGPAGLASPMPIRQFPDGQVRIRPVLGMRREQITAILEEESIPYRTDSTNEDTSYTRNWLRKSVIPVLKERFPQDIHAASARSRILMEEAVMALDEAIGGLDLDLSDPSGFDWTRLAERPPGLVRRAVMAWWLRHYPTDSLPTRPLDELVAAISSGGTGKIIPVGRLGKAVKSSQVIVLDEDKYLSIRPERTAEPPSWMASCHWHWPAGPLFLPNGACLLARSASWPKGGPMPYQQANPATEAWLCGIHGPLLVRQWQSGDRYQPLGAPGRRKLQDLFTDAKLNSEQKKALPVIIDGSGAIVWVPGFPPADAFRICQNENSALQLTYLPHLTRFPKHHGG